MQSESTSNHLSQNFANGDQWVQRLGHKVLLCLGLVLTGCAVQTQAGTIRVPAGGNFQAALNQARPGDFIQLQAGASYEGNFNLPNKPGSGYITIESSALSSLPPENVRANPSYAQFMPKLVSPNVGPVISAKNGAHHFRFIGIEFHPAAGKWEYNLVSLGTGQETSLSQLPHDFVFDRDYVHGDPKAGSIRGIALNAGSVTVENSYISGIAIVGQDTQALCGWNGPGPYNIINNYLEASGENVMFGGARAFIPNVIPSDIVIRHNYFFKPLSWKIGSPGYAGTPWTVKNLLEFKSGQRITIDGNIFENCWGQAQHGSVILFTPRTIHGQNEWTEDEDITVTHNIIRHAVGGIDIGGTDDTDPQKGVMRIHRILIKNNLLYDLNGQEWGNRRNPQDWLFLFAEGSNAVTIDHNTGFSTWFLMSAGGDWAPNSNFTFTNNIALRGKYGVFGSGTGEGKATMAKYFPEAVFKGNVLVGASSAAFPPGNFYPGSLSALRFQDLKHGELSLLPRSPYFHTSTDGKPAGADIPEVLSATAGVVDGNYPHGISTTQ
ncbi:MAG TPA: hypothetical protein VMX16_01045 [Terriglobia bacterium]|nr:hypothetical protein [Terriglobia bacterium]